MAGLQQQVSTPTMLRAAAELAAQRGMIEPDTFWGAVTPGINRLAPDLRAAFTKVIPYVPPIDWGGTPIPRRWHSCTRMSWWGKTRVRGKDSVIPTEVCPCGGYRMLDMGDRMPSYWMDRNTRRRPQ